MRFTVSEALAPLAGGLRVPPDKSMSHRAVLFSAMAEGTSGLAGVLDSADVRSTIGAVRALGASVTLYPVADGSLSGTVTGWGALGPGSPESPVECGNSGTTTRLLAGVLAGWPIRVELHGDESLSRRPMGRITGPLEQMGARFTTSDGCLPMSVLGTSDAAALKYESPIASAQVKSAVLLAGLRAQGRTSVTEPAPSRDHTERMLPLFGVSVGRAEESCSAWVDGPAIPKAAQVDVPADPSSAAFLAVAASIVPGSKVMLSHVGLNPTRTGFMLVLERMGVDLSIAVDDHGATEPVGTVVVSYRKRLVATIVTAQEIPALIDEIPVLAVIAAQADGVTRFEGVSELRVKESDRLQAIVDALTTLGVVTAVDGDILEVTGLAGQAFSPRAGALFDS
ncbi:MAG: 3-phosphoshikimate 1-carboxyvinyltransferase, partial [Coriobacteriia bacterium]|nr:3-phosphoshikimate 1-carboxyvinyltransferase [Coriobacteriia bacterium]